MTSKDITLIGVPLEEGSGRGGCAMGPAAFRLAGIVKALEGLGFRVVDNGDLRPEPASDLPERNDAKNLPIVAAFTRALEIRTYEMAKAGTIPVIMGGDHALSMGSVPGMARYAAEIGRPLFVLWLDAHTDFNTPETSPSGNIHGMPVAFFTGQAEFAPILDSARPKVDPKTSSRSASAPSTRSSGSSSPITASTSSTCAPSTSTGSPPSCAR